jgi:translation initiation factor eIF-2B subunit beta
MPPGSSPSLGPTRGNSTETMSLSNSGILESPGRASSPGAGLGRLESGEDFARQAGRLKPILIQAIEEVVGELETTHEDVAKGAREHIHSS